jgi:AcrR family transcriptional regulator
MTRHLPEQTRREQILSAARKCFIERGYHPTRMEDIASTAGLSKGGVYFHFDSKREVFDALVEEEFSRSVELLRKVSGSDTTIVEKMSVIASYYLEYFNTAPDAPRFFIVMGEMGLRDEALAKKLLEMQTVFIEEASKLVDQGVREGILREVDSKAVGALLKAIIDGIEGLTALQYTVEAQQLLATGLDLVLNGLAKR